MSTFGPEPRSCWECGRGKILRLPDGGEYVDCLPANWKWPACASRLLDTIANPLGRAAYGDDGVSEPSVRQS
jgi:hypothetical protein